MIKLQNRKRRGQTTIKDDCLFNNSSDIDLINLLVDPNPQKRTSAAKLIGKRRSVRAVIPLCRQLAKERALYSRIAISEALGKIGEPALAELALLLGRIGGNQHDDLPNTIFKKWNYPCPRDIVARTINKIGIPALKPLRSILKAGNTAQVLEAIDSIGYISFYAKDTSSFPALLETLRKYRSDNLIVWKIVRAFQAFPSDESIGGLEDFLLNSKIPALRWESARSLGQIGTDRCLAALKSTMKEQDPLVKKMIRLSIKNIGKRDIRRFGSN